MSSVGSGPLSSLYRAQINRLIESHSQLPEYDLKLAIWYNKDHEKNVCLLEVLDGFPVDSEATEPFSAVFSPNADFPLAEGGELSIAMTSTEELREIGLKSTLVQTIVSQLGNGFAEIVYQTKDAKDALHVLNSVHV